MTAGSPGLWIEWGFAGRALPGEPISGDLHLVSDFPGGALAAVIDGLGHGPDAAAASAAAAEALKADPASPVLRQVAACHAALRSTRGVVLSLAAFNYASHTVSWVGVGNVEGILLRADGTARESIVSRAGVVGYQLPPLREASHPVRPGDLLILATDGIRSSVVEQRLEDDAPQAIANRILALHGKTTDDALVLVVRYLGAPP
jgi:serine phosphatase RsbU (regulator of sigma subunit)